MHGLAHGLSKYFFISSSIDSTDDSCDGVLFGMNQSIVEESIFRFLAILQMYDPDQCVNFVKAGVHL